MSGIRPCRRSPETSQNHPDFWPESRGANSLNFVKTQAANAGTPRSLRRRRSLNGASLPFRSRSPRRRLLRHYVRGLAADRLAWRPGGDPIKNYLADPTEIFAQLLDFIGAARGIRTPDPIITNTALADNTGQHGITRRGKSLNIHN